MPQRIDRRCFVAGTLAGVGLAGVSSASPPAAAQAPAAAATPRSAASETIAIAGVTLIDATGGPPLPNTTVVIQGDRIAAVQPTGETRNLADARVVDGAGRFLIPGLWDAHVHTFVFPWQPDVYFPLLLANGVTGVRDMGGALPMPAIDAVRAAIASGERLGPRIVAGIMVDGPVPVWPFAIAAGTAAEGRAAVAAIAAAGADFVKVYTLLPRGAYLAIADAANARHLSFAGHVPISVTAGEASDAGQRTIEHFSDSLLPYCATAEDEVLAALRAAASGPDPVQSYAAAFFASLPRLLTTFDTGKAAALADRFVSNQTSLTPTLIIARNAALAGDPALMADPRLRYLPTEVVAAWSPPVLAATPAPAAERIVPQQLVDTGEAITLAMQRAGVSLLAGTDLGLPFVLPGFSLHDELALMVAAGLTPLQALQAATRNPAQAIGRGDDLGTVAPGKLADLVLLDADPLADIANTTRIAAVITAGRVLERPALQDLLQTTATAAATPAAIPAP
jgi:imidazolonepropionase-like amidohydrolase